MDRTALINFLSANGYSPGIKDILSMNYLKELCACCLKEIRVEDYLAFLKENPSAENNVEKLKEWRASFGNTKTEKDSRQSSLADSNTKEKPEKTKEESLDGKDPVRILQEENEFLTSWCLEQETTIGQMATELESAWQEEENHKQEIKKYQQDMEVLKKENKELKENAEALQLSLNANLIEHSVIEKKKFHDVPQCRSDVEFATFLFERERELTKEQRGFVFECLNKKVPHRIIWQHVSAGYDVGLMRNLVELALKEEAQKKKEEDVYQKKKKRPKNEKKFFSKSAKEGSA